MDGLTPGAAAASGVAPARRRVAGHLMVTGGMLVLMVPAMIQGHASLAGIGVTFAFFAWAAIAAVQARRRDRGGRLGGAVGDPFAMGLMMAVPYLALGVGGHAHRGAEAASSATGATMLLALIVIAGWTVLRAGAARVDGVGRLGFWSCLLMMVGMLAAMSIPS